MSAGARRRKGRQPPPSWELRERVIAVLEKAIAPEAQVRHNVRLPVIASRSGRWRQCDVVIYAGKPPRQTIAIVEVQKRGRAANINEFHGWLGKMHSVGAHQLICVSERPFPTSVQEEAARLGPVVKLLTLGIASPSTPPLRLVPHILVTERTFEVEDFLGPLLVEPQLVESEIDLPLSCPILSVNEEPQLVSVNEVLTRLLNSSSDERLNPAPHDIPTCFSLGVDLGAVQGATIWFHHEGTRHAVVNWPMKLRIAISATPAPFSLSNAAYVEHGIGDPLAWVSQAIISIGGASKAVTVAVQKNDAGEVRVSLHASE